MAGKNNEEPKAVDPLAKIANLLAILATKGMASGDQTICLSRAGFTYAEIADLAGTTYANAKQTVYAERKGLRKKKKKSKD